MNTKRSFIILLVFSALFIILTTRIYNLQINEKNKLSRAASAQRIVNSQIIKERGNILDRNGIPLQTEVKTYYSIKAPDSQKYEYENDLHRFAKYLISIFKTLRRS